MLQNLKDLLQKSQKAKENEKNRPASAPLLCVTQSNDQILKIILSVYNFYSASGADNESLELSAEVQPNKGRGVLKVMPLSGVTCYGDHCDFANKIRVNTV